MPRDDFAEVEAEHEERRKAQLARDTDDYLDVIQTGKIQRKDEKGFLTDAQMRAVKDDFKFDFALTDHPIDSKQSEPIKQRLTVAIKEYSLADVTYCMGPDLFLRTHAYQQHRQARLKKLSPLGKRLAHSFSLFCMLTAYLHDPYKEYSSSQFTTLLQTNFNIALVKLDKVSLQLKLSGHPSDEKVATIYYQSASLDSADGVVVPIDENLLWKNELIDKIIQAPNAVTALAIARDTVSCLAQEMVDLHEAQQRAKERYDAAIQAEINQYKAKQSSSRNNARNLSLQHIVASQIGYQDPNQLLLDGHLSLKDLVEQTYQQNPQQFLPIAEFLNYRGLLAARVLVKHPSLLKQAATLLVVTHPETQKLLHTVHNQVSILQRPWYRLDLGIYYWVAYLFSPAPTPERCISALLCIKDAEQQDDMSLLLAPRISLFSSSLQGIEMNNKAPLMDDSRRRTYNAT